MTRRMPTLLPFGEGSTSGEAIDMCTRLVRRGSGRGTSEGWFVVTGGDPSPTRVAASTFTLGNGHGGSRTGQYEQGSRVMPVERRAPTSGTLIEEGKVKGDWR